MSSIAAYGSGIDHRESAALVGDDNPDRYAQHKAGPRQPFYRERFFWDRLREGRPIILPDNGETPIQWVFVSDLAEACVRALEVPDAAGEAFNVAHTEPHTQRSFVEALARTAGVRPTFTPIPRATIHAAGGRLLGDHLYFGEFLDLPAHTSVIDKAQRLLGITPTSLEAALASGFSWYQAQPRRQIDCTFEDRLLANA
jgi:2'-hydroxyisoflavone reductase